MQDDAEFLYSRPVLVNLLYIDDKPIYQVYAGNQRVRAAKKLHMKEIPCIVEEGIDEEKLKKRIILDNKTFGEFDFDILANEWDINVLIECGFSPEDLIGDLKNISDDERNDEAEEECKVCEKCGSKLK